MTNEKKVIKEFELFIKEFHPACTSEGVELDMFREVLSLLKEQEPAKPVIDTYFYRCKKCGHALCGRTITEPDNNRLRPNYCSECGKEVKWERHMK